MAARMINVRIRCQTVELEFGTGATKDFVLIQADADEERMPANLAERDEPGLARRGVNILKGRAGG
jgi:hypothetical protein